MSSREERLMTPVTGASAWKGSDLARETGWIFRFSPRALDEIDTAIRQVNTAGIATADIRRENFPLPTLATKLKVLANDVENGRGFTVMRGIPMDRYSDEDATRIYWGLCCYFGTVIAQNTKGDLIGQVRDRGFKWGQQDGKELVRGYLTRECLPFHSDSSDRVGLLCLRQAKEGGMSSVVSSMTIFNEILAHHPDVLDQCYEGFYYSLRGEQKDGKPAWTPNRIPVFSHHQGRLSAGYVRKGIDQGREARGLPYTAREEAALKVIDTLSEREDLRLDMMLEPGDIQYCNNYTILHSRTSFVDHEEPDLKRHLLRIWLYVPDGRPLAPSFANRYGEHSPYAKREAVVGA